MRNIKGNTKRCVSALLLFAMLVSLFAGMSITVSAAVDKPIYDSSAGYGDVWPAPQSEIAQRLCMNAKFNAIKVRIATYKSTTASCDIAIYKWNTDYQTTISATPIKTESYAVAKGNLTDGGTATFSFEEQEKGEYLFRVYNINSVTAYAYKKLASGGCAYKDGVPLHYDLHASVTFTETPLDGKYFISKVNFVEAEEVKAYDPSKQSERDDDKVIPLSRSRAVTLNPINGGDDIMGQHLNVGGAINGFAMTIPTYGKSDSQITLAAYKWNKDVDTSMKAAPIASSTFKNINDGVSLWVYFDTSYPAGEYLFVATNAIGNAGVYRYPDNSVSKGKATVGNLEYSLDTEMLLLMEKGTATKFLPCSEYIATGSNSAPAEYEIPSDSLIYSHEVQPSTWVFTDGLGRTSLTNAQVGDIKEDKTLATFYWDWHYSDNASLDPFNIQDHVTKYGDHYGSNWEDSATVMNSKYRFYWNEPIYGYYTSTDTWVLRRQAEMLANAGVDVVFNDNSNQTWVWQMGYESLYETWTVAQKDGVNVPKISYHLPMWYDEENPDNLGNFTNKQLELLYLDIYQPEKYQNLWYYFDGKPMIIGMSQYLNTSNALQKEIKNFFTLRSGVTSYTDITDRSNAAQRVGSWGWSAVYPQATYFKNATNASNGTPVEQISVSVANNFNYSTQKLSAMNAGQYVTGRSYTSYYQNRYMIEGSTASLRGYNFAEQFDYALSVDPDVIFVTGYNEWKVGMDNEWNGTQNAFQDQFSDEYSRDIEPSKGALKDHYYYQLVNYSREYKGAEAIPTPSVKKTIDISAGQSQWSAVEPYYAAYIGNTDDRDGRAWSNDLSARYTEYSGRNDIIGAQIARDDTYVYFNVECRDNITPYTDNLWMNLYIDVDQNNQGWETFDYVVNRSAASAKTSALERFTGTGYQTAKVTDVEYTVDGRYMTVKILKSDLGISGDDYTINFAWTDNVHDYGDRGALNANEEYIYSEFTGDIMDFYISGDVAPGGRFKYSYVSTKDNSDTDKTIDLYNGTVGGDIWHWQAGAVWGQRFTVDHDDMLTSVHFPKFEYTISKPGGTFKVWQWNKDYSTTTSQEPLYEIRIEATVPHGEFTIYIPEELKICGEVYYEIDSDDDSQFGMAPIYVTGFNPENVYTYLNGDTYSGQPERNNYGKESIYSVISTKVNTDVKRKETTSVPLYTGSVSGQYYNSSSEEKFEKVGQYFVVADDEILTSLYFDKIWSYDNWENSAEIKIYRWMGSYSATVAEDALYTYTFGDHSYNKERNVYVDPMLKLNGELFYEFRQTSGERALALATTTGAYPSSNPIYVSGALDNGSVAFDSGGKGIAVSVKTVKADMVYNYVSTLDGSVLYSGSVKYENLPVSKYQDVQHDASVYADDAGNLELIGFSSPTRMDVYGEYTVIYTYYSLHRYDYIVNVDGTNIATAGRSYVILTTDAISEGKNFIGWYDTDTNDYISYNQSLKYYPTKPTTNLTAKYGAQGSANVSVNADLKLEGQDLIVTVTPVRAPGYSVVEYGYLIDNRGDSSVLKGFAGGSTAPTGTPVQSFSTADESNGASADNAFVQISYNLYDTTTSIDVVPYIVYTFNGITYTLYGAAVSVTAI